MGVPASWMGALPASAAMTRPQTPGSGDAVDPHDPLDPGDPGLQADPAAAEPRRERQQDARRHRAEVAHEPDHGRHGDDRSRPPSVVRKSR